MALGKRLAAREFQSLLLEILQMGEKEKKRNTTQIQEKHVIKTPSWLMKFLPSCPPLKIRAHSGNTFLLSLPHTQRKSFPTPESIWSSFS